MKRRSLGAGFLAKFVTSSLVTSGYKENDLRIATHKILTYSWLTVFWFEVLSGSNYRESLFNWICVTTITRLDRKPFNHKLCINCFKATVAMTDDRFEEVIRKTTALLILARLDNWLFAARCVNWIFLPLQSSDSPAHFCVRYWLSQTLTSPSSSSFLQKLTKKSIWACAYLKSKILLKFQNFHPLPCTMVIVALCNNWKFVMYFHISFCNERFSIIKMEAVDYTWWQWYA